MTIIWDFITHSENLLDHIFCLKFRSQQKLERAQTLSLIIQFKIFQFLLAVVSNCTHFLLNSLQAIWDWVILFLVIYTAIFTPYVAAFLLNEPGYGERSSESYGSDPIVIIDLLGDNINEIFHVKIFLETLLWPSKVWT